MIGASSRFGRPSARIYKNDYVGKGIIAKNNLSLAWNVYVCISCYLIVVI